MAQRVNPNAFRIGASKPWNYKYLENKTAEQPNYDFNNLEIKNFILKFFKDNNVDLYECKINYLSNNSLQIFLSYYKLTGIKIFMKDSLQKNDYNKNYKLQNSYDYQLINYFTKSLDQNFEKTQEIILKKDFYRKSIENSVLDSSNETWAKIKLKLFLNNFMESLRLFLGQRINTVITFQELNKNLKRHLNIKSIQFLKRSIAKLNRYRDSEFFKEGITTLYICSKYPNSAKLLAEFLARFMRNSKNPKFFLTFIKKGLTVFKKEKKFSFNEIKIKLSGRLAKSPRARQKVIKIANKMPVLSIKAHIDYAEKVAFTSNGTVGVKVWIYNKNAKLC